MKVNVPDGQRFDVDSDPDPTPGPNLGKINDQFKSVGSASMFLKVFFSFSRKYARTGKKH
jgi:hypothetical protein